MILKQMRRNAIRIEGEKSSALEQMRGRLLLLGMFFILSYMIVAIRLIDLGIVQGYLTRVDQSASERMQSPSLKSIANTTLKRGNIYDRNHVLLATTLKTPALFVDPGLILDKPKVADQLVSIFPDLSKKVLLKEMMQQTRYVWLRNNVSPDQQFRVLELGEPGLGFEDADTRIYPQVEMAAHMVGYTDRSNRGLAGIERSFDKILTQGKDVSLTIDVRLQHLLRREMQTSINDFTAIGGAGVIMDANSGEILAAVSLPDYDLNFAKELASDELNKEKNKPLLFNRPSLGVYELGSMFKIFSTAALLETQKVPLSKTFDARTPIYAHGHTINDYHAQKRILNIPEIFMYSSNIGTALMGKMVGGKKLSAFYKDLGLLNRMDFDIWETGRPVSRKEWTETDTMTASYGHGVSTTPIQMCAAVATVVNGGFSVRPSLVKESASQESNARIRIISQDTSDKMRSLMRLVVTHGTGKNAEVNGYYVGGKTGTAEKSMGKKGYDHTRLISSFVAAFPIDNPKYIIMVMIDEPKGNKKSYGYATAGWVAAPAVANVIKSMGAVLGIPSDQYKPEEDISLSLEPLILTNEEGKKKLVSY